MKGHRDLLVWKKSMRHVAEVYEKTKAYPKDELFGLVSQMRRAAVSVPSNIAEGYGRSYDKETYKFLSNALGSASELETKWILSRELGFIDVTTADMMSERIAEIIRMLTSLIKTLPSSTI